MSEAMLDAIRRLHRTLSDARAGRADAERLHSRLVDLGGAVCFAGSWLCGLPTNDEHGDSWHARVHACIGHPKRAAEGTTLYAMQTGKAADLRAAATTVRRQLKGLFATLAMARREEMFA